MDITFKPGDKVVFKNWYEMECEYGLVFDNIDVPFEFTPDMEYLCGRECTISYIAKNNRVFTEEELETKDGHNWWFSSQMFKYINHDSSDVDDIVNALNDKLLDVLNG